MKYVKARAVKQPIFASFSFRGFRPVNFNLKNIDLLGLVKYFHRTSNVHLVSFFKKSMFANFSFASFKIKSLELKNVNWKSLAKYLYSATNVGFILAFSIILEILIGIYLDNRLVTKPLFTLIFLILGIITGIYQVIKFTKENFYK